MKKLLIILLIFSNTCFAQEVVTLKMGDLAPFNGVLFSTNKEIELRQINEKYKKATELNGLYEEKINLQDQRIQIRDKEIEALADKAKSNDSFWKLVGAFVLGSVITTGVVYGVTKATR